MGYWNKFRTFGTSRARVARVPPLAFGTRGCVSWLGLAYYALTYNVGQVITSSTMFEIPSFAILALGISELAIAVLYLFSRGVLAFGANVERGLQWVVTHVHPDSRSPKYYE